MFNNGQMDLDRLKDLVHGVGKQRLVLDLSCRKKVHFFVSSSLLYLFGSKKEKEKYVLPRKQVLLQYLISMYTA